MQDLEIVEGVCLDSLSAIASAALFFADGTPSAGTNNVGGWKSAADGRVFAWPGMRDVGDYLRARFPGHEPIAWMMVNRFGSLHKRHTHGLRYTCGVLYITAGDPPVPTIFETPAGERSIEPSPGRLVIFPGGMFHRVPRYDGEAPRISLAFEIRA